MKSKLKVEIQKITAFKNIPKNSDFKNFVQATLGAFYTSGIIGIRIVNACEIQRLNRIYRHKDKPTNVLSFTYEKENSDSGISFLGDIVLCAPVINKEAKDRNLDAKKHWAHMVIHGCLHIKGYSHNTLKNAKKMEAKEQSIMKKIFLLNHRLTAKDREIGLTNLEKLQ